MTIRWYELSEDDAEKLMRLGAAALESWEAIPAKVQSTMIAKAAAADNPVSPMDNPALTMWQFVSSYQDE